MDSQLYSGDEAGFVYDTPALVFEPAKAESGAKAIIVKAGPPITLKQLFEIDWQNLPAYYSESVMESQDDSGSVKMAWRVNGDFVGR